VEGCFPGGDPEEDLAVRVAKLVGHTGESPLSDNDTADTGTIEKWREILRLCTAICAAKDVDSVLLAILTPKENESRQIARARAILALSCLADEPNVSVVVAKQVIRATAQQVCREDVGARNRKSSLNAVGMELIGTPWAEEFCVALVVRYYKDLSLDAAVLASSIGSARALTESSGISQWLAGQIAVLRRECELNATYAALCIMGLAHRRQIVLIPGLVEALTERLSGSEPMTVVVAWALAWLARQSSGIYARGKIWKPSRAELDQLAVRRVSLSNPVAVRFVSSILEEEEVGHVWT
jgi:hypothetical protein